MNHRIKNYAEQATEYAWQAIRKTPEPLGFMDYYTEHLAELIVKQCAELSNYNLHGLNSQQMILEHFSMERKINYPSGMGKL